MTRNISMNIEQRLAKLELANRRWRRLAACAVIGLGCLGVMGAEKEKVIKATEIEAQRIVVTDANGKRMITLGTVGSNKFPGMTMSYPGSRANASFFVSPDHATLALMDNNGASSITLNSGGAESNPDLSIVKVAPGGRSVQRMFRAP